MKWHILRSKRRRHEVTVCYCGTYLIPIVLKLFNTEKMLVAFQ